MHIATYTSLHTSLHVCICTQFIPKQSPQALDSQTPLNADTAYSVFQNYLQTLNKEHRAVDSAITEAKCVEPLKVDLTAFEQETEPLSSYLSSGEHSVHNRKQVEMSGDVTNCLSTKSSGVRLCEAGAGVTENRLRGAAWKASDSKIGVPGEDGFRQISLDHMFGEEAIGVKSAIENYRLELVQTEEQLSRQLSQKEVIMNELC